MINKDVILAIETSCDETAVAILQDKKQLRANIVYSQIAVHADFGGVIPEVASRIHVEKITLTIKEALKQAEMTMEDITAIAVTAGPGLIGALHVGLQAAKALAWYYDLPLIPVHHIVGHIYANQYVDDLQFPLLALVVSGGHTELVFMKALNEFEVVAQTSDDAIGEAYDKVARILNAGYPGGPIIDQLAKSGQPNYKLPIVKVAPDQFSYSGLKSAVLQLQQRELKKGQPLIMEDVAYAFQHRALGQLMDKTITAIDHFQPKHFVIAGGVAANSLLRQQILDLQEDYPELKITIPPLWTCTDNAAMIAMAAALGKDPESRLDLSIGAKSSLDLNVF